MKILITALLLISPILVLNAFAQCKDGDSTIQAIPDSTKVNILQTTASTIDLVDLRQQMQSFDKLMANIQLKKDVLCKQYQSGLGAGGKDSEQYDCAQ